MLTNELMQFGILALAAAAIGAVAYSLLYPYFSGERQVEKRRHSVIESRAARVARAAQAEQVSNRRKAVADTLKEIEDRQNSKQKLTLRLRLQRAGLNITPKAYWIASGISGGACALLMMVVFPNVPSRRQQQEHSSGFSACRAGCWDG